MFHYQWKRKLDLVWGWFFGEFFYVYPMKTTQFFWVCAQVPHFEIFGKIFGKISCPRKGCSAHFRNIVGKYLWKMFLEIY